MAQTAPPILTNSDVRKILVDNLRQDLMGPSSLDEEISDSPLVNYLTGVLYPQGVSGTPEEDDSRSDSPVDEEVGDSEISPSPSFSLRPSSIGLSCDVDSSIKDLTVDISFGTYEKIAEHGTRPMWHRKPHSRTLNLDLTIPQKEQPVETGVNILWKVRPRPKRNSVILSVFLINTRRARSNINEECLFQPSLTLKGKNETRPFVHRLYELFPGTTESEAESFNLLFRDNHEFAVGHGCSVGWDGEDQDRTARVWTEIMPHFETPRLEPFSFEMDGLDMNRLAMENKPSEMRRLLKPLPERYASWIEETQSKIPSLSPTFQKTAAANLIRCRHALERIRDGIEAVCENPESFEAFKFANKAMSAQLSRIQLIIDYRKTGKRRAFSDRGARWRPFQLAFILLNIRGIANPLQSQDRSIVDLLWFPTGGGKTEAYLGLAAFVIAHRRLKAALDGTFGGGVTVLMRYTLRLLTIQQFQRAASLICACELIRRQSPDKFGNEPFLLGLWVGQAATPNTFEEAVESLHLQQTGGQVENTPLQIQYCPWCGEPLSTRDYWADQDRHWILVECPRRECEFHGHRPESALPILTVDEDIYRRCPSLLIATVDKFARIAWNFRAASIFGRVNKYCPRHGYFTPAESHARNHGSDVSTQQVTQLRPPELIIQDELHLITGPLGTMVGLYETAIDYLCCWRDGQVVVAPKVIASTATIRRAGDQINRLFARGTSQFPPTAIESSDTFFAREISINDQPGRLYVGVCAPGRSIKFALVWIFASLLQSCESVRSSEDAVDPYWTLVGYFNSLRELGGALRLTEDDIPVRMGYIAHGQKIRQIRVKEELTSRKGSAAIPDILARLDVGLPSPSIIDILIATNMLSVGVDIQRLGLMTVDGQPKSTSEYLQATSRVGRRAPGLIVVLYNWVRPRDMSHYERFQAYHSMLYRHVDAASVTPFGPRARDRGLKALFVAMARVMDPVLMDNKGAQRFTRSRAVVAEISHVLETRAALLDPTEASRVKEEIQNIIDQWEAMVNAYGSKLIYVMPPFGGDPSLHPLLKSPEDLSPPESWSTPDSLRNVERMANLYYHTNQ